MDQRRHRSGNWPAAGAASREILRVGTEDKAHIGFLTRQYYFDSKGFIGKDKAREWSDEYENLLW